ncbi:unnamed protein product [Lasius platythorax]|uniref:Uncharacterized protein n=1 Tax=Lasius platythorax TaxID=488582 RepID=A0AAV2P5Z5_9HYME
MIGSREKPDANKSSERMASNGQRGEVERVEKGLRLQYGCQASSGDGNKREVMILKRRRWCRAPCDKRSDIRRVDPDLL